MTAASRVTEGGGLDADRRPVLAPPPRRDRIYRQMPNGVRKGLPELRPYSYRGTDAEPEPAEIVARLHEEIRQRQERQGGAS